VNLVNLDLGCGSMHHEGFIRVDNNPVHDPDVLMDMQDYVKTLLDDSIEAIICTHTIEFLEGVEIYEFMNNLHRILKPNGILRISVSSVVLPSGKINPKAWTVPLLKTHFSPDTFDCFLGGPTFKYRGVKSWVLRDVNFTEQGEYTVWMFPDAD